MADFTAAGGGGFESRIGRVIAGDPGCSSPTDTSERNPNVQCDDGVDNDGDGQTDTVYQFVRIGGDAGCSSPTDVSERFDCDDGIDNDGDGTVDTGDPGCAGVTDDNEIAERGAQRFLLPCDDGIDNDGDGLVDFRTNGSGDPGCASPRDADERGLPSGPQAQQLAASLVPLLPSRTQFAPSAS